jgi:DNA-binding beta-propeller fold protein YncE
VQLAEEAVPLAYAAAPLSTDYLAFDAARSRVWIPLASASGGSVAIVDAGSRSVSHVDGFKTTEREVRGGKRTFGPSAVSIGPSFAYVGDRGTSEVCAVDLQTQKNAGCTKLPAPIDGVVYVPTSREVWVTTPTEKALAILDASKPAALKQVATIKLDGEPEGYAVDSSRGLFFTNLEDKGDSLSIDIKTRKVVASWRPGCGESGPRGLAIDAARRFLVVACTDKVQVLDVGHDGAVRSSLDAGAGIDNVDYVEAKQLVYVGAAKASRLTVAHLDDDGKLVVTATAATPAGARNPVADASGAAYVVDNKTARLLVFRPHP